MWNHAAGATLPFVLALVLSLATAGVAPAASRTVPPAMTRMPAQASVLIAAGGIGRGWSYVEHFLSSRTRMLQLAIVGMAIGLFILMRK
jgi:hypothetical protein